MYQKTNKFLKGMNVSFCGVQKPLKLRICADSIDFSTKKTYHIRSCEHFYAIDYGAEKTAERNR